jgi:cytidylate kinase
MTALPRKRQQVVVMMRQTCYNSASVCKTGGEEQRMPQPSVITIDGPAGSGKSTLGELLAHELGYLYFDTGVMYRALTLAAQQHGSNLHDEQALERLARQIRIEVVPPTVQDGRQYTVLIDEVDVTWDIRSPDVDRAVSLVSSYPAVRAELIRQQRLIGQRGEVVMVGRDIGRVVMPDAPLKIYLHVSLEERARRRAAQHQAKGSLGDVMGVQTDLARRDAQDEHVMQPADDAVLVQNEGQTATETVARIIAMWR